MPKNRQEIPKAERQAAILACAGELFVRNGYRGTSVAAIGRAAGLASAAVHWYYPTKDDLFAATLRDVFTAERLRAEAANRDPRRQLVDVLTSLEPYRRLHREAYERMGESEALRAVYVELQDWLDGRMMATIQGRLPQGVEVGKVAELAQLLFEGVMISVRRRDWPIEKLVDGFADLVAAALS